MDNLSEKMSEEEKRHLQLMNFMTNFKSCMEISIKTTNDKLDTKLEEINIEIKEINGKIDDNEEKTSDAMTRMDTRLKTLEEEMKNSRIRSEERKQLLKEAEESNAKRQKQKTISKQKTQTEERPQDQTTVRRQYNRRVITQEDLQNYTTDPLETGREEGPSGFRSSWAKELAGELNDSADKIDKQKRTEIPVILDAENEKEQQEEEDIWDRIGIRKKKEMKVRTPIVTRDWFADTSSDSDSTSTDSQEEGDKDWNEVDRQRKNQRTRQARKLKKKKKMEDIAGRMRHMIGLGPIPKASLDFFADRKDDKAKSREKTVIEYLRYYLDFSEDELNELEIMDTKQASKEDIIYIALKNENHIREIHFRRAASGNDDLIVRDYIPPPISRQIYGSSATSQEEQSCRSNT